MKLKRPKSKMDPNSVEKKEEYSDEEMLDLSKEVFPLSHYVDDEDELVAQLFATIKQTKLQSMLPPLLKEIDLKELQSLCLHEIRGMSRKRILAAINGQHLLASSSEDDEEDSKGGAKSSSLKRVKEEETKKEYSEDSNPERLRTPPPPPLMLPPQDEIDDKVPAGNLTALDIIELEMRAKLIKTMLDKQPSDEERTADADDLNGISLIPPEEIKQEPRTPERITIPAIKQEPQSPPYRGDGRSPISRRRSRSRSYSRSRSRSSFSSRSRSYSRSRSQSLSEYSTFSDEKGPEFSPSHRKSSPDSDRNKKKKITKKEFQERMQKAKMNRRYRKRSNSDSDSDEEEHRSRHGKKKKHKRAKDLYKRASWEVEYFEKLKSELKKSDINENKKEEIPQIGKDVEEGEYESKEEGEIESGEEKPKELIEEPQVEEEEEEEGACTPSDEEKGNSHIEKITELSDGSLSPSSHHHSKRRKRKKRRKSIRHSRSRSKTPPLLQRIRKTKKHPAQSITPIVEPLISQDFENKMSMKEISNLEDPTRHTELIESDDNMEDSSKDSKGIPIPANTKPISFSISKKSLSTSKLTKDPKEPPLDVSNKQSFEVTDDSNLEAADQVNKEVEQKSGFATKSSFKVPEEEVRYVVPCLEMPGHNKSSGPEDLSLLFTDWDEGPISETQEDSKEHTMSSLKEEIKSDGILPEDSVETYSDTLNDKDGDSQPLPTVEVEEESSLASSNVDTAEHTDTPEPMDIIGVIEPRAESNQDFDEELIGGSSWSSRWLQSEKVQNVVSNSKILSKVRKKIQSKGKDVKERAKEKAEPALKIPQIAKIEIPIIETKQLITPPPPARTTSTSVIGSIEEYEKLIGLNVSGGVDTLQPEPKVTTISLLDSDDEQDSEEEALWSKIMKK